MKILKSMGISVLLAAAALGSAAPSAFAQAQAACVYNVTPTRAVKVYVPAPTICTNGAAFQCNATYTGKLSECPWPQIATCAYPYAGMLIPIAIAAPPHCTVGAVFSCTENYVGTLTKCPPTGPMPPPPVCPDDQTPTNGLNGTVTVRRRVTYPCGSTNGVLAPPMTSTTN